MDNTYFIIENIERLYSKPFDGKTLNRDTDWKLKIAGLQKVLSGRLKEYQQTLNECPVCKSKEFTLFVEVFEYKYSECNNCHHIFCVTPPDNNAVKALYDESNSQSKSTQKDVYLDVSVFNTRIENIAVPKVKYLSDRVINKGKWIDVGCGVGELVIAASRMGWDTSGIESDPDEVEMAQHHGANVQNAFLNMNNVSEYLKDASIVSLINVLEHIPDPVQFLKTIIKAIPSGAHILIEVPRHPSISSLSNRAFPEHAHRHIYSPDHLHIFTEKSVSLMLEESNAEPISMWCFGQDMTELFSSLAIVCNLKNSTLYDSILNMTGELQKVTDTNNLSDTMLLIARKQ